MAPSSERRVRQQRLPFFCFCGSSANSPAEPSRAKGKKGPLTTEDITANLPPAVVLKRSGSMVTCVVCLEEIEEGELAITTQCDHTFHADCVMQWWTAKNRKRIHCPVCRQKQHVNRKVSMGIEKSKSVGADSAGRPLDTDLYLEDLDSPPRVGHILPFGDVEEQAGARADGGDMMQSASWP